ncbi:MAG: Gfo/Idh/MocA family oxidoreductase [Treponema sp.]|nr:Gfo/Idh/MocA family oxidoreductase [Treponema sp.]MCL2272344.1 Gfo/Idh/MocA family oxidoreductase [Treponema sp.]
MQKIKAVIAGLGRIASLLEEDSLREKPCTHAGAIAANSGCMLAAGCDIDGERRSLFSEKWNVPVFQNAQEMLLSQKPDILVIATHPDSHYFYCRLASDMQVPVVLCEKPLADNLKDARKIAYLSRKGKTKIIVNHERRYSLDYIRVKKILEEEKYGSLASVRAVLYMGKTRRLIDQFWHDGTHLADTIMFLTGGILKHRRRWGAKLSSHNGTAWLEGELYPNSLPPERKNAEKIKPIPVILEIGSGRDHLVFEIEFSCEKGRLRIGNGVFEVFESVPSPYAEKFRSLKDTGEKFSGPTGYFANMLEDAVSCVRNSQLSPVSGAIDGLRVIEYLSSVKRWR